MAKFFLQFKIGYSSTIKSVNLANIILKDGVGRILWKCLFWSQKHQIELNLKLVIFHIVLPHTPTYHFYRLPNSFNSISKFLSSSFQSVDLNHVSCHKLLNQKAINFYTLFSFSSRWVQNFSNPNSLCFLLEVPHLIS